MKRVGAAGILVTIVLFICLAFYPVRIVTMTPDNGNPIEQMVGGNESLTLTFLHSLYHVYQHETYKILRSGFELVSVVFESYDAAAYWDPFGDFEYDPETGWYSLSDLHYIIDAHIFTIAHQTDYTITIGEKKYDINDTFPEASKIVTTVTTEPLVQYVRKRVEYVRQEEVHRGIDQ